MNFWKLGIREFNKMNSELCEFLETWCTGIFKNESRIFSNFQKLGKGILKKIKNKSGVFSNFRKLGMGIFLKMNPGFFSNFQKLGTGIF